jgi:hypothetical protein
MTRKYLLIALLIYLSVAAYFYFKDPPLRYDHVNWPEKEWVVKRMAYHGISACVEENGKYYFYRNGRQVAL